MHMMEVLHQERRLQGYAFSCSGRIRYGVFLRQRLGHSHNGDLEIYIADNDEARLSLDDRPGQSPLVELCDSLQVMSIHDYKGRYGRSHGTGERFRKDRV